MALNPISEPEILDREQAEAASRIWWILLLNGIVTAIAGILILSIPWTLETLALFIGAVLIVRGILQAFSPPLSGGSRSWNVTVGIISAVIGLAIIVFPAFAAITLLTLALFIGAWFIVLGIAIIAGSISNRRIAPYWWLSLIGGILSVAIGIFALYRPILTLAVIVVLTGIWAIVIGAMEIGLAFEVRRLPKAIEEMRKPRAA